MMDDGQSDAAQLLETGPGVLLLSATLELFVEAVLV